MPPEITLLRDLSLDDALQLLRPAMIFAVGVGVYAVIIFTGLCAFSHLDGDSAMPPVRRHR